MESGINKLLKQEKRMLIKKEEFKTNEGMVTYKKLKNVLRGITYKSKEGWENNVMTLKHIKNELIWLNEFKGKVWVYKIKIKRENLCQEK